MNRQHSIYKLIYNFKSLSKKLGFSPIKAALQPAATHKLRNAGLDAQKSAELLIIYDWFNRYIVFPEWHVWAEALWEQQKGRMDSGMV